ncbi:MAG: hypothetical protein ACP5KB_04905 [Thermoprotei archaeon]
MVSRIGRIGHIYSRRRRIGRIKIVRVLGAGGGGKSKTEDKE